MSAATLLAIVTVWALFFVWLATVFDLAFTLPNWSYAFVVPLVFVAASLIPATITAWLLGA